MYLKILRFKDIVLCVSLNLQTSKPFLKSDMKFFNFLSIINFLFFPADRQTKQGIFFPWKWYKFVQPQQLWQIGLFVSEMVTAMKTVASLDVELTVEERNLLSVAYKNVIGARRASWRIISSIEQKEENKASEDKLKMIKSYRSQVMNDFHFWFITKKQQFSFTAEMMTHSTCPLVTFQLWLFPRVYFHCNHSLDVFVEFYCLI